MRLSTADAGEPPRAAFPPVVELDPGRLYLLGDTIALDGRISWVPKSARGWQPINTYVLTEGSDVLIIDPGIYAQRDTIRRQLASLVPEGNSVSVFVTRAEPDTAGNLGEISARYPVEKLYAGGGPNPFDAFEAVSEMDQKNRGTRIQMERMPYGYMVPVNAARGVEMMRPIIRLLSTYWGYDAATRTLFTSDSFGHTMRARNDGTKVLRERQSDRVDPSVVKAFLLSKFGWIEQARTTSLLDNFRSMRGDKVIERIAPGHGLVIEGVGIVEQHLDAMDTVLMELAA